MGKYNMLFKKDLEHVLLSRVDKKRIKKSVKE